MPNPKREKKYCCDNGFFNKKHECLKSNPDIEKEKLIKSLKKDWLLKRENKAVRTLAIKDVFGGYRINSEWDSLDIVDNLKGADQIVSVEIREVK